MSDNLSALYPYNRVAKLYTIEKALGVNILLLREIILHINSYYYQNPPDNKGRITHSVREPLKTIQKKIKNFFLDKVIYPPYLHAYIKKRSPITNAQAHLNKKKLINEDISKFFDNCNARLVFNICRCFFNFSIEVAKLLTQLTTLNGKLPQGTQTSPSLSNLIFWKDEPILVEKLEKMELTYTRYGDDITVSLNKNSISQDQTKIIASIYGMMFKNQLKPKRKKHKIYNSANRMLVNGQIVNSTRVTLGKNVEGKDYLLNVRAAIHNLEKTQAELTMIERENKYQSILGKLNHIQRYNSKKATDLKIRLEKVKVSVKIPVSLPIT